MTRLRWFSTIGSRWFLRVRRTSESRELLLSASLLHTFIRVLGGGARKAPFCTGASAPDVLRTLSNVLGVQLPGDQLKECLVCWLASNSCAGLYLK